MAKARKPNEESWKEIEKREIAVFQRVGIPKDLYVAAMYGLYKHYDNPLIRNTDIMTIIDFRRTGRQKRLWVIDRKNRAIRFHEYVSHGVGSGPGGSVPNRFSNTVGSNMSSLGSFATGRLRKSSAGNLDDAPALTVHGLDALVNSAAHDRYILFHGATYVVDGNRGRAGTSHGCFATADKVNRKLIPVIKNGTFVYSYNGCSLGSVCLPPNHINEILEEMNRAIRNKNKV